MSSLMPRILPPDCAFGLVSHGVSCWKARNVLVLPDSPIHSITVAPATVQKVIESIHIRTW